MDLDGKEYNCPFMSVDNYGSIRRNILAQSSAENRVLRDGVLNVLLPIKEA